MGYGDEIMVSSIAKRIHAMTNTRVRVMGADAQYRLSDIWRGLDYLTPSADAHVRIVNGPGYRHYYTGMENNRILWRKWNIAPGEIRLTDEEREWAALMLGGINKMAGEKPFVVLSSHFKGKGGGGVNKDWGMARWRQLVAAVDISVVRLIGFSWDGEFKDGCDFGHHAELGLKTPSFRHACAILERSIGYVGHEGGLHHAAAALGKPAVVVFGGYISPAVTGYPHHINLYSPDDRYPLGCGSVTSCQHCRDSMSKITVEQVVSAVREMISNA